MGESGNQQQDLLNFHEIQDKTRTEANNSNMMMTQNQQSYDNVQNNRFSPKVSITQDTLQQNALYNSYHGYQNPNAQPQSFMLNK
jgi:hypothetical protein